MNVNTQNIPTFSESVLKDLKTYIIQDDQRSVDAPDGIVADARLNRGHAGILELRRHYVYALDTQRTLGEWTGYSSEQIAKTESMRKELGFEGIRSAVLFEKDPRCCGRWSRMLLAEVETGVRVNEQARRRAARAPFVT